MSFNLNKDLNFFKFLTLAHPVRLYDNEILSPLLREIKPKQIKKSINDFVKKFNNVNCKHDLNLYLHIPYCLDNCGYCHCAHSQLTRKNDLLEYEDFLIGQILEFSPLLLKVKMGSLYFGGGTPSLLSKESIRRIFEALFKHFRFKDNIQINFEAHPSSLTSDKLRILKEYGVNRLSLGVQSLDKEVLKAIGRVQNKEIVYSCIDNIRKMRIPYLNIDLIAGLPSQSIDSFLKDLKNIIKLKPEIIHVIPFSDVSSSYYYRSNKLDIHEFVKRRHIMIYRAKQLLKDKGYKRYGFEAYQLRKGGESYQEFSYTGSAGSILGLGIFAKTNLAGEIVFESFLKRDKFESSYFLGYPITKRYTMANFIILNLIKGFTKQAFKKVFNEELFDVFGKELSFLKKEKKVIYNGDILRTREDGTLKGLFDYFCYTKVFYGDDILSKLKLIYKNKYHSFEDYNFNKYFTKISQDHWITCLYYDMGL